MPYGQRRLLYYLATLHHRVFSGISSVSISLDRTDDCLYERDSVMNAAGETVSSMFHRDSSGCSLLIACCQDVALASRLAGELLLESYYFGALAGRCSMFTDFVLDSCSKPTILEPWLVGVRFSLIFY